MSNLKKKLHEEVKKMYDEGLIDETFVMEAVEKTLGGTCKKSSRYEDMREHIDFWWDSPKRGIIGIDVKGVKKKSRKDSDVDDTMNWIEMQNVNGRAGWIYGKSAYIAFRTKTCIIFVSTEKLRKFAEEKTKGKELVHRNPKDFYVPYQRFMRHDVVFKCPTSDLLEMSDFIIEH